MKRISTIIGVLLLVFILSSCSTEEVEITVIIYSEDYQELLASIDDLPELIGIELQGLGFEFDRIILQSTNDVSIIESSLNGGIADMAILDPSMIQTETLVRVLDVVKYEVNYPESDMDQKTYQKVIVSSSSLKATTFLSEYEGTPSYTDLNGLNVCNTIEESGLFFEFAVTLGATTYNELDINHSNMEKNEVFEGLENNTCDLGVVTLEDVNMYELLWDDNPQTLYEDLTVVYTFEPLFYEGFYVSENADESITNALIQAFIQLASHHANQEILDLLGHSEYSIPTE